MQDLLRKTGASSGYILVFLRTRYPSSTAETKLLGMEMRADGLQPGCQLKEVLWLKERAEPI